MEWNEVKSKPKRVVKKKTDEDQEGHWGGVYGGHFRAGAVAAVGSGKTAVSHHASAVADQDFLRDENEEIKYETVSHECAIAIQSARLQKEMTQAQLAKAVNEKTSTIVELENGTAKYVPDTINRIEKVLGVKIPRGRAGKKSKAKKKWRWSSMNTY